jgi:integrase
MSKPQGTDTYCYSREEVVVMIAHCRSIASLHWLSEVLVALACTGLRISELASLRWTDLDFDAGMLRLTDQRSSARRGELGEVRRTKGKRDRTIPLADALIEVLRTMKRRQDGYVFHGPRGGRLKPDTVLVIFVREVIEPLQKRFPTPQGEIRFEHGRIHSFRHYFCSRAFAEGANEADVKQWLGHQDSQMVAHYRHFGDEESREKLRRINFLDGSAGAEPA